MFCEQCGNKLPENAMFCPKCGTPVSQADENIEVQNGGIEEHVENVEEPIVEDKKAETKRWKKFGKIGKIVIASVLGVVLMFTGSVITRYKMYSDEEIDKKIKVKKTIGRKVLSDEEIKASKSRLHDEGWCDMEIFGLVLYEPKMRVESDYTKIEGREEEAYFIDIYQTNYNEGREYYVPFTVQNEMNNGVKRDYTIISVSVYNMEHNKYFEKNELNWMKDADGILRSPTFLKETNDFYCFYDVLSGGEIGDMYVDIYLCVKNEPIYYKVQVGDLRYLNEGYLRGEITNDAFITTDIDISPERVEKIKSRTGFEPFFTKERLEDYVNACEYIGYKSIYKR